MEAPEDHIMSHFEDAYRLTTKPIMNCVYAFQGLELPSTLDFMSYKLGNKTALREGLEDMLGGEVDVEAAGFKDFYNTLKQFM